MIELFGWNKCFALLLESNSYNTGNVCNTALIPNLAYTIPDQKKRKEKKGRKTSFIPPPLSTPIQALVEPYGSVGLLDPPSLNLYKGSPSISR